MPLPPTALVANLASTGLTVPADFMGLSVENSDLLAGMFQGSTGAAASYIGVVQLLGSKGDFRVGGSSSETPTTPALTQTIANNLCTFTQAAGANWRIIYNLDLIANNSTLATTQAGYLQNTSCASSVVYQSGNEPFGSGNYTTSTYPPAWNAYYAAVTASIPAAKFCAFDDAFSQNVQTVIAALTPGRAGLNCISMHWYGYYTGVPTADQLALSSWQIGIPVSGGYGNLQNIAWASTTPTRMTETNSRASTGVSGVSNRFMAATFALNEAISLAQGGYAGLDFHNYYDGSPAVYNPVVLAMDGNFIPGPVFYGMLLFSKLQGQQTVAIAISGSPYIRAMATQRVSGKANVLAVNNNPTVSQPITVDQSSAWTTANVLMIQDPNGCSGAAPTIGGQAIGESGVWTGAPFTISNGQSIQLPPCGAALISVQ